MSDEVFNVTGADGWAVIRGLSWDDAVRFREALQEDRRRVAEEIRCQRADVEKWLTKNWKLVTRDPRQAAEIIVESFASALEEGDDEKPLGHRT